MSIYSKLSSLLTAANNKTGESDTTLTDAVQTLIDGYGQGGGGTETEDNLVTGNFTTYTNDRVTSIRSQFFSRMSNLQSVSFANVTSMPGERHFDRSGISSVTMSSLPVTGSYMFNECQSLINIPRTSFPLATTINNNTFVNCQHLETADFPSANQINANAFSRCYLLAVLVLRANSVCSLANVNAFENTPIRGRNGMSGTIYIPKALYDHLGDGTSLDYEAATNWSTICGEGHCTFAAIEGSQYE